MNLQILSLVMNISALAFAIVFCLLIEKRDSRELGWTVFQLMLFSLSSALTFTAISLAVGS